MLRPLSCTQAAGHRPTPASVACQRTRAVQCRIKLLPTQLRSIEILLVEDFEPDARLFSQLLAHNTSGYRLNVVTDGEQAVNFLDRSHAYHSAPRPNLIFLDLNLPKRNGFEILEHIRSNPVLKNTPVVVLTSSQNEKDVNAAYGSGANLYVRKPGTLHEFEALMQALSKLWFEFGELPSLIPAVVRASTISGTAESLP